MKPKRHDTAARIVVVFIAAAVLSLPACFRSDSDTPGTPATIPAVDSLLQAEIANGHVPGAVLRVQKGDSVLHEKAYGFALRYGYGIKLVARPDTMSSGHLFDLASLTKVCGTTFGIMLLLDRGEIALDDPVYHWLPEFENGEKQNITVRHLLNHTSGLSPWIPTYYYASDAPARYRYVADLPLRYSVGEGRHYSDLGFMLLGDLIQRVTGMPLDLFLNQQLYEPLGLGHTVFNPLKNGFEERAIAATSHGNPFEKQMVYDDDFGYRVDAEPGSWDGWREYTLRGEVNDGNAWYAHRGVAGHAGLFSTVSDLQVLVKLLLDKGRSGNDQFISEAVIDRFLTKGPFGNGLGWAMDPAVYSAKGVPEGSFGHTGFTGTSIVAVPEYDLSIILLTNRQNAGRRENGYYVDLGPLRQEVVDRVLKRVKSLRMQ